MLNFLEKYNLSKFTSIEELNSRYKFRDRNFLLINFHIRFREGYKTVPPQEMSLRTIQLHGITLPSLASLGIFHC